MANRSFERAFNRAAVGSLPTSTNDKTASSSKPSIPPDGTAELSDPSHPGQAAATISKIMRADKDQDLFSMLELPLPEVDDLGRPVWSCSAADVSRAFRRLSVLVHPDKNPEPEARPAFEALSSAHRQLRDPGLLEEILNKEVDRAKDRRDAAEANATPDERIAMNAAHRERAKELRQKEGQNFQAEILRQLKEKQNRAKRRRQAQVQSRHADFGDDSNSEQEDTDVPAAHQSAVNPRHLASKRGRPKLIF
ncbi:hypothetical protein WJX74_005829 [Apatococcus lobatus]|uniref:J domain-containing protein n=1 Tax=Apatococcus lobatus TaxID=904363 RepID=A0AAW1RV88_9CHLO